MNDSSAHFSGQSKPAITAVGKLFWVTATGLALLALLCAPVVNRYRKLNLPVLVAIRFNARDQVTNIVMGMPPQPSEARRLIAVVQSPAFRQILGERAQVQGEDFALRQLHQVRDTSLVYVKLVARNQTEAHRLKQALDDSLTALLFEPWGEHDYIAHPPRRTIDLWIANRPPFWRELFDDFEMLRTDSRIPWLPTP